MDGKPPDMPWEDDDSDDVATWDFSVGSEQDHESGFDAFDAYLPAEESEDIVDTLGATDTMGADRNDERLALLFTVTNPPGTVSVSAFIDARIHQVNLSAKVTDMTESQLADEIMVIAGLAQQKARSAQYALLLGGMTELGHDSVETGGFLGRELGLPSPDQVKAEMGQLFATRYAYDQD